MLLLCVLCLNVTVLSSDHLWLVLSCYLAVNKKTFEGKVTEEVFFCVGFCFTWFFNKALRYLMRASVWQSPSILIMQENCLSLLAIIIILH